MSRRTNKPKASPAKQGRKGRSKSSGKKSVWDAAEEEEERVKEKRKKSNEPWRFFQDYGESCEVIFLDESIDDAFFRREHALFQTGRDGKTKFLGHEPCIASDGPCPHCEDGNESGMVVMLSVLVLREFTSKKTKETHTYSKKLLAIKHSQLNAFGKLEKIAKKQHGTLRGVSVILEREDEKNAYRTGMPVADEESGNLIADFYEEEELIEEFGHPAKKSRDKKRILKEENEDIEPYDYDDLFPEPDSDAIREAYGMDVAGSRKANARYDDDDDDIPMDHDDDGEEEEDEAPKSRRSRRKQGKAKAEKPKRSRGSRRKTAPEPEEDEDEDEEEEEDAPPPRRKGRGRGSRRRQPEPDDDDGEDDDDDEPEFDD